MARQHLKRLTAFYSCVTDSTSFQLYLSLLSLADMNLQRLIYAASFFGWLTPQNYWHFLWIWLTIINDRFMLWSLVRVLSNISIVKKTPPFLSNSCRGSGCIIVSALLFLRSVSNSKWWCGPKRRGSQSLHNIKRPLVLMMHYDVHCPRASRQPLYITARQTCVDSEHCGIAICYC